MYINMKNSSHRSDCGCPAGVHSLHGSSTRCPTIRDLIVSAEVENLDLSSRLAIALQGA